MGAGAGGGMGGGYGLPSPYMYPQQQPSYGNSKGGQGPMYSQSPFGGGGSRYKSYNSYSQPNQFYGNNYGMGSYPAPPKNPFEGNEKYQALMDYQKSMGPTQEQISQYGQLQKDFEQSSGFKDYRIKQLEDQQNLIRNIFSQNMMGGIGAYRDQYGPSMRRNFGGFTQRPTIYPVQTRYIPKPNEFKTPPKYVVPRPTIYPEISKVVALKKSADDVMAVEDNPYGAGP